MDNSFSTSSWLQVTGGDEEVMWVMHSHLLNRVKLFKRLAVLVGVLAFTKMVDKGRSSGVLEVELVKLRPEITWCTEIFSE